MSFIRFNNAEGQASGTTVTAANSGGASGYALDTVAGTITFDNSQFFTGAQSYKIVTASSSAAIEWNIPGGPAITTMYSRFYVNFQTSAFTNAGITSYSVTGSIPVVKVTGGKLVAAIGATSVSGVVSLSAATWYRVEVQVNFSTTTPSTVVNLCAGSATTPLETITATGSAISSTAPTVALWGSVIANTTGTMWIDEPAVSDQGWIGTATGSSIGPVAKANNAAGGTNAGTPSTASSGGTSGDAFDLINGSPKYSWTIPRGGGGPLDYYCGSGQNMQWNLPGTSTDFYARTYVLMTSLAANAMVHDFRAVTSVYGSSFFTSASSGKLSVTCNGLSNVLGTYVPSVNIWYRLETHVYISATAGYAEAYLYDVSGTQLDYVTTLTTGNTAAINNVDIGQASNANSVYYDSPAVSDVTWCGPAAVLPTQTSKRNSAFLDFMG